MKILRLKDVTEKTGLSRSTIYYLVSQKQFPSSIPLGARSVGWLESEINEWLQEGIEIRRSRR
ncbi:helix-turn-helix transcriptional regulator [Vibrio sp. VB16]|uniref:helix-turn-helix transcriptional regulator n=1 Tax=Vibrio sp. VB16 TaxID=2785746 RepID=UPI00189D52A9|nr:AlpA family transcriptional regulator [Vibrio sp. VB16]UGA53712.1 AlpA family transcriptional regulator [Vibrio sp. VB16]